MAQTVQLHGGPMHGQIYTLEDGRDHMHILVPNPDYRWEGDAEADASVLPTKEGIYSRVAGRPHDFEWDGFKSHD